MYGDHSLHPKQDFDHLCSHEIQLYWLNSRSFDHSVNPLGGTELQVVTANFYISSNAFYPSWTALREKTLWCLKLPTIMLNLASLSSS